MSCNAAPARSISSEPLHTPASFLPTARATNPDLTSVKPRSDLAHTLGHPLRQAWKAAQLFFSLCISVALFSQSPFGLPFAVIGFWKFGFPETMGCFRRAYRVGKVNVTSIAAYINGIGTLIHHCSGALLIVACTTHLMPLDRRVLSMSMPLVAQHLVVLFRYWNKTVYGLCELVLEICWEWEILANIGDLSLENGYDITTRGICISMIFAHWCYWGAALLSINSMFKKSVGENIRQLAKDMAVHGLNYEGFVKALHDNGINSLSEVAMREMFVLADRDSSGTLDSKEVELLIRQLALTTHELAEEVEDVFEVSEASQRRLSKAQNEADEWSRPSPTDEEAATSNHPTLRPSPVQTSPPASGVQTRPHLANQSPSTAEQFV